VIDLAGVGHVYADRTPWAHRALTGIELRIGPGERILVVGHNGSGKSTLAWILAGLLRPTEGSATLDGEPVDATTGTTAMAFQHARLQLLRPTVAEDVGFGTDVGPETVDWALDAVGLEPTRFRARRIDDLSGGEQRRVALAGVLVRSPRLLVLDEPLAGLDARSRRGLVELLERLGRESEVASVVVTHDTEDGARLAERAVVLRAGQMVADGIVDDVLAEAHL